MFENQALLCTAFIALALSGTAARADLITPTVAASDTLFSTSRLADYMIDGSSFDTLALTHGTANNGAQWTSGYKTDDWVENVVFDLGANYELTDVLYWNFNPSSSGTLPVGVKDVEILVASSVGGSYTSLGSFVFAQANGSSTYAGGSVDIAGLTGASNVREVKFVITSNHGWTNSNGALVGLAEIRFEGTTAVPEPGSLALLGLGGLCVLRRRR